MFTEYSALEGGLFFQLKSKYVNIWPFPMLLDWTQKIFSYVTVIFFQKSRYLLCSSTEALCHNNLRFPPGQNISACKTSLKV